MTLPALLLATALLGASAPAPAPAPSPKRPSAARTSPLLRAHLKGKTVLFLGDSMIMCGLDIWARQWIKRHGGRYHRISIASSTTRSWATQKRLSWALRKYRPDLVFFVLGANELQHPHPATEARSVRAIVKKLGTIPFRWIGPPIWRKDTGIVRVIAANLPKGRFYKFNGRKIGRARDGKHPSVWGSKTWANDIFRWYEQRLSAEGARP